MEENLLRLAKSYSAILDTVTSREDWIVPYKTVLSVKGRIFGEFLAGRNGKVYHVPSRLDAPYPNPSYKIAKRIAAALYLGDVPVFDDDGTLSPAFKDAFFRIVKPITGFGANTVLPAVMPSGGDTLAVGKRLYKLEGMEWHRVK